MRQWYRQCNSLADVAGNHTSNVQGQIERIQSMKNQVHKASAISKHIRILGDINIDASGHLDQVTIGKILQTLPIYQQIMSQQGLIILYKRKTRYNLNDVPTLIDHITMNLVNQIHNISKNHHAISDHCMVFFNLHSTEQVESEKYT